MTVKELVKALEMTVLSQPEEDRNVSGAYACDLLSRVMTGCNKDDCWITVQTHLNVLAVAELSEAACVIIPEGISVEKPIIEKARNKGICILTSEMNAYQLCWRIHELLL
ncbi:MAG: DRTGG domain-containing protein [Anaerovoracaceae bacterium]